MTSQSGADESDKVALLDSWRVNELDSPKRLYPLLLINNPVRILVEVITVPLQLIFSIFESVSIPSRFEVLSVIDKFTPLNIV